MSRRPKAIKNVRYTEEQLNELNKSEAEILDAIRRGDLKKIESFEINEKGIDSNLCKGSETKVYPSKSHEAIIERICGPTVVIYSILCEQPEILTYFITKFNPNLLWTFDGWAPIHFAAATKDSSCLKVLLSCLSVQQNINIPITDTTTTALYIAALYQRHEAALLLTTPSLIISIPESLKMKRSNTINVSEKASTGFTALHIAVQNQDWEMCRILLACGIDTTITNNDGKSAYDMARELDFSEFVKYFEDPTYETREDIENQCVNKCSKEESDFLEKVLSQIDNLTYRVNVISKKVNISYGKCTFCDNVGVLCHECQQYFCDDCWNDPRHRC